MKNPKVESRKFAASVSMNGFVNYKNICSSKLVKI